MGKKNKTASFLGGALVGLGLGFLFAPKSGSETRKELGEKISLLWDNIRGMDADEIKEKLESKLAEIEKGIRELDKEKVINIAKEKATMLKNKVEELVEMAKDAGKPVVEEAAKNVKRELAKATREVLKKLETEEE